MEYACPGLFLPQKQFYAIQKKIRCVIITFTQSIEINDVKYFSFKPLNATMKSPGKASAFKCVYEDIAVYVINSGEEILHLTFSEERHTKSIEWLLQKKIIVTSPSPGVMGKTCKLLQDFLTGKKTFGIESLVSPFLEEATPFQKKVWELISKIPYGETKTYGELAKKLGNVTLSRAVGGACNANPLALIIPCHRVVGVSGLGGFAGGIQIKETLLKREQSQGQADNA